MFGIIYSPKWFYGKDIAIDVVSIAVSLLIASTTLKYYKLDRSKKKHFWVSAAFIMIASSFLFKIMTNFTLYHHVLKTRNLGFVKITYTAVMTSDFLFDVGFFMYRVLTIAGFYALYSVYEKQSKNSLLLTSYLLLSLIYFSGEQYYVFHLTTLILALLIASFFRNTYSKNKKRETKGLWLSFEAIALSQLLFMFVKLYLPIYVIAETVQLIGYSYLLVTFMKVLRHAKEKRTHRHHP